MKKRERERERERSQKPKQRRRGDCEEGDSPATAFPNIVALALLTLAADMDLEEDMRTLWEKSVHPAGKPCRA